MKGIAHFISSLPNHEVSEMGPYVMFSPSTTQSLGFYFLVRLSVQQDLIPSQGQNSTNIHIPVCLHFHGLACFWDRVMQCFIWHTSCYVMASVFPIIFLLLLKPAVKSYLCFTLPPNKWPSLFCESHMSVLINVWQLQFI